MKAVTYTQYGSPNVLKFNEVPTPKLKDDTVLIRVKATTVTSGDWRARSLTLPPGFKFFGRLVFGICRPRQPVLGTEASGEVVAVGKKVTKFEVGDTVFAFPGSKFGSYAEYLAVSETGCVTHKPTNLNFMQAAALSFGGTTALDFLRDKGDLKAGDKVLIIGASGGVGNAAVQIAKHFGAHVTGVCSSKNLELVKSWGADHVIDYTQEDFAHMDKKFDIILDTTATTTFARCKNVLTDTGKLLLVSGSFAQMLGLGGPPKGSKKTMISGVASENPKDLLLLKELAQMGAFTPYIDQTFPLSDIAKAHAIVDTGRKRGNLAITVQ